MLHAYFVCALLFSFSAQVEHDHFIIGDVVALINEQMPNREDFLPSEIALNIWSMRKGIISSYHEFVDPGKIWLGYRAQFMDHQEKHQIPEFYQDAVPSSKYHEVFKAIQNHVNNSVKIEDIHTPCKAVVPVITSLSSVNKVNYTLNEFLRESYLNTTQDNPGNAFRFEVYSFDEALLAMLNNSNLRTDMSMEKMIAYCENEAKSLEFEHLPGMMCEYHSDAEASVCAQANARKLCFMTTSALKKEGHFDIPITGKNFPVPVMESFSKHLNKQDECQSAVGTTVDFKYRQTGSDFTSNWSSGATSSVVTGVHGMNLSGDTGNGDPWHAANPSRQHNQYQARVAPSVSNYSSTASRPNFNYPNTPSSAMVFDGDDDMSSAVSNSINSDNGQDAWKPSGRSRSFATRSNASSSSFTTSQASQIQPGQRVNRAAPQSLHNTIFEDDDDAQSSFSVQSAASTMSHNPQAKMGRSKGRGRGHGFGKKPAPPPGTYQSWD